MLPWKPDAPAAQAQPGPRKRQKIEVACNKCKARKSKCDGRRPVCGPCSRRKGGRDAHACLYRPVEPRVSSPRHRISSNDDPPSSSYVVHGVTPELDRRLDPLNLSHDVHYDHDATRGPAPTHDFAQSGQLEQLDNLSQASPAPSDGSAKDRDVDAMGCVDSWALRHGLLGTASGASFMRQLRKVAEGSEIPDPGGAQGSRSNHVSNPLLKLRRQRVEENDPSDHQFVLPPKKTADHLFKVYWDYSDPIFPWLDREEITQQYESLWTASESTEIDEKVFHCTLNLMFAIASHLDPVGKPGTQSRLATNYYARANALLGFNLLDISHFQILQTLLLAAQYLQSTNMPRQCFQAVGMAVWIAQDMGLHLPQATESLVDRHECELARRVWHGCIVMDKIAAMTFGRPARISKEVADQAPYPLAEETFPGQPTTQPAKLAFFIAYCKLHHILGDVLESFYTVRPGSSTPSRLSASVDVFAKRFSKVFDIEGSLAHWRDGLEEHLRTPSAYIDESETGYVARQANILHARYLYTRLLLFRPFLTQALLRGLSGNAAAWSAELPASNAVVVQCQILCVQTAQQIIELLFKNLPMHPQQRSRDVLPTWWYTIAYVYSASLVLIAAHMFPTILTQIPSSTLNDDLARGYQILQHYEDYSKSAIRCRSALQSAQKKLLYPEGGTQLGSETPLQLNQHRYADDGAHVNQHSMSIFPWDEDLSWLTADPFDWE